jgi:MoaA/NifB/PqqE/SkfB family radical SAM enzyme
VKQYKFKATIQSAGSGGACVLFPYDVEKEFGTRGQVPVRVSFDGVAYTGTMVKYGRPEHMLPILKAIREKIDKGPGDTVSVVVERDAAVRTVEVPAEFAKLMKKEGVLAAFENLSYTHRKEYCRWIAEAKREETRANRLTRAIEMLKAGVKTPG